MMELQNRFCISAFFWAASSKNFRGFQLEVQQLMKSWCGRIARRVFGMAIVLGGGD